MALTLQDVRRDPVADRALKELMRRYAVAERSSGLVLAAKAGDMKLFFYKVDDLHEWDFVYVQKMRASLRETDEERETWKRRALRAEMNLREAAASPRSGQAVSDLRYATLRRWLAKKLHPDCAPGNGPEKVVRNEIFKEIWSEIERLDRQLSMSSTKGRRSADSEPQRASAC
jgi:hypothetical protein